MPEVKDSEVVLKVEHLKKYFPMGKHAVLKAVDLSLIHISTSHFHLT